MRKLALLVATPMALLATTGVALAQSTEYSVSASTSPAVAGSAKKPVPVQLKLGILNTNPTLRPSTSKTFQVGFAGLRSNGKAFKTCAVAAINRAGNANGCSSAAKVGSGFVHNFAGNALDPADKAITCDLKLTIYNSGNKKAALFLQGGPGVAGASCPISISQALDARFVRIPGGEALRFDIPENLQHPITGIDNGIASIDATINKKVATVKKGRKKTKVGFFEAVGGCRGGSRAVSLSLTSTTNAVTTVQGAARC